MQWNEHVTCPVIIYSNRIKYVMSEFKTSSAMYGRKSIKSKYPIRGKPARTAGLFVQRKAARGTSLALRRGSAIPRARSLSETKVYNTALVGHTIDQRLEAGNQQAVLFQPSIGAASNERIGNRVFLKGVQVTGWLNVRDNMDKNHLCRIALYRLLSTTTTPTTAQLNKIVNQGGSATHLGENLINLLKPWNTDYFKIYKSSTQKLGKSAASAAESNNDYKQSFYFKWWIPINETIFFDDTATTETNFGMYFGGAACESDGTVASPQSAIVNYEIDFNFRYTDK